MVVLLDTGPLVAWLSRSDPRHAEGAHILRAALAGHYGEPQVPDYVLDEALTLVRSRLRRRDVAETLVGLARGPSAVATLRFLSPGEFDEAIRLHFLHYERGLSFTDCTLLAAAARTGATIATFDGAFRGLAPLVEA